MTDEEQAAFKKAADEYLATFEDNYVGLKLAAGFFVYTFLCISIGIAIGTWL